MKRVNYIKWPELQPLPQEKQIRITHCLTYDNGHDMIMTDDNSGPAETSHSGRRNSATGYVMKPPGVPVTAVAPLKTNLTTIMCCR